VAIPGRAAPLEAGKRIRRQWRVKDFVTALDFFRRVGQLADGENHHPDLGGTIIGPLARRVGHRSCAWCIDSWSQAAIVEFNKQAGMSHGKISRVFQTLFGIPISRGGSTQVVLRLARRSEPIYASICETVRRAPWNVPDETGWRVGGLPAWLHALVTENATAYVIHPNRSGEVAERLLGLDYGGGLIHDGWSPYDNFCQAQHQQCLGHLLRRCNELLETATRGAVCFPRRVSALLHDALDLRAHPRGAGCTPQTSQCC
jgi:hypothetical protein